MPGEQTTTDSTTMGVAVVEFLEPGAIEPMPADPLALPFPDDGFSLSGSGQPPPPKPIMVGSIQSTQEGPSRIIYVNPKAFHAASSTAVAAVTVGSGTGGVAEFSSEVFDQQSSFTDESTGSPTAWEWNFGDGSHSSQQNPTHTYSGMAGNYDVSLRRYPL